MSAWKPSVSGRSTSSSSCTIRRQLCMPPQQISPSAASRSPCVLGDVAGLAERLGDPLAVGLRGPSTSRPRRRPSRSAPRRRAERPARAAAGRCGSPCGPGRETVLRSCLAAHRRAAAGRRPDRRDDRADDQVRASGPCRPAASARRPTHRCRRAARTGTGRSRRTSTPSTSAAAVRSSIVSRSIGGSESGPLPTTPGQAALCSFGKLLGWLGHGECPSGEYGAADDRECAACVDGVGDRSSFNASCDRRCSGSVGVDVGAEVAQAHQRLVAGVLDLDAGRGRFVADEDFVLGLWPKWIMAGRLQVAACRCGRALHGDPAAGAGVLERALGARARRSIPWP